MDKRATRQSHINVPLDTPRKIALEEITISEDDYEKFKKGLYRPEMGNRLFIFFEDNWLYIHHTIEGIGLYKVEIKERAGTHYIDEFYVEGNKDKVIEPLNFDNDKGNIRQIKWLLFGKRW